MSLLTSQLFQTPPEVRDRLEQCLLSDPAHIFQGNKGEHVRKIQVALNRLSQGAGRENFNLKEDGIYGPKTAAAVKRYKNAPSRKKDISPQQTADDIVGKKTIKSLDDEMGIFENELPSASAFVSLDVLGAKHDHIAICPLSGFSAPGSGGRVHHLATPIRPLGTGSMINIGGEDETKYLGFKDFSTRDTLTGGAPVGSPPGRPFTEGQPSRSASDIFLRSSPVTPEIKKEISRLARPGCRLTIAQNSLTELNNNRSFLLSVGAVLEDVAIFDKSADGIAFEVIVVSMRGDGRYVETNNARIFPPGRVIRNGQNVQVVDN